MILCDRVEFLKAVHAQKHNMKTHSMSSGWKNEDDYMMLNSVLKRELKNKEDVHEEHDHLEVRENPKSNVNTNHEKYHGSHGKFHGIGVTAIHSMIGEKSFAKFAGSEGNGK